MEGVKSLLDHFTVIIDPRTGKNTRHNLQDIIVLSVCGIISGCETFVDIENYGKSKIDWLRKILDFKNGIPSHDTIGRVFSLINSLELQKAFYNWTRGLIDLKGETINLDGKYITSSLGATSNKRSIFGLVNAWASEAGLALAQLRTDYEKKNEKKAFKEIINFLELEGALVTIDANGAHAEITNKIVDKKGDFLVGLKKNQKSLLAGAQALLRENEQLSVFETLDKGHGRIEKRKCEAINFPHEFLNELDHKNKKRKQIPWKNLRSVCQITSERIVKGKSKVETRFYLSSLEANSSKLLSAARSHWGIENKLHWVLDVSFNEDRCRVRKGYAGENLAVIRQLALNLLKQERSTKKSVKSKRLTCGWENKYLRKIITGMTSDNLVF